MLKVATYNVNSIRSRIDVVLAWVDANLPDVLCLQETKVEDKGFPRAPFEERGYHVAAHGQKSYNGVATISREAPSFVATGFNGDTAEEEARLLRARIGAVDVINAYVPQGTAVDSPRFTYKLAFLRRLRLLLETQYSPQRPLVIVGDLNVAPEPIDVYDPVSLDGAVCFHPLERAEIQNLLAWGLVDVFRLHNRDAGLYTFWDYFRGSYSRNRGWRLDHMLATAPLASKSVRCVVDRVPREATKPSDHTVVVAEFDV
jgi:exodeoxyribonuclease-3